MNTERLLREVERRLAGLPEDARDTVIDALREEIARERRRIDPSATVELERERRLEAETLRDVLEAINRQARLEDTIGEVLKQLSRIVVFDSCLLALAEGDGRFRVLAVRGYPEPGKVVSATFSNALTEQIRVSHWPVTLSDVQEQGPGLAGPEPAPVVRSWAGLPLLVEGEVIGLLSLDRHRVEPFGEEDLHRAKAVAFSASAAIRKAQLLDKVRRYAALMESLVTVDQAVFAGETPRVVASAVLEGAVKIGTYRGGLLLLGANDGARVAAAAGPAFDGTEGRVVPAGLAADRPTRLTPDELAALSTSLGLAAPPEGLYSVPFGTPDAALGTLLLLDPDGDGPDDRLMEAYASRSAAALRHVLGRR